MTHTGRVILVPARRLHRRTTDPNAEQRDRRQRAYMNAQTEEAGEYTAPWPLFVAKLTVLRGLLWKPCTAHSGTVDERCPASPAATPSSAVSFRTADAITSARSTHVPQKPRPIPRMRPRPLLPEAKAALLLTASGARS